MNDIRLRRIAVADMRDIANINRIGADGLDRQIIQFLDGLGTGVEVHVVFQRADFYRSGGQNQVLRPDRVHHIVRGDSFRLERRDIQVHLNLALLSPVGIGQDSSLHGRQLHPDEV